VISQKASPADGSDSIAGSPTIRKLPFRNIKVKTPSQIIAAIADLSNEEGPDDGFSGSDHDKVLYGRGGTALDLRGYQRWFALLSNLIVIIARRKKWKLCRKHIRIS